MCFLYKRVMYTRLKGKDESSVLQDVSLVIQIYQDHVREQLNSCWQ